MNGGQGMGPQWHGSHTEGILFYATDHLGSLRVVVDTIGQPVETRDYAPFGRTIAHTGDFALKHQFTGQPWDDTTGLQQHGARMYNVRWGRWLSADEAVESFDSQGLNPYAYVRNQPTSLLDQIGTQAARGTFHKAEIRRLEAYASTKKAAARKSVFSASSAAGGAADAGAQLDRGLGFGLMGAGLYYSTEILVYLKWSENALARIDSLLSSPVDIEVAPIPEPLDDAIPVGGSVRVSGPPSIYTTDNFDGTYTVTYVVDGVVVRETYVARSKPSPDSVGLKTGRAGSKGIDGAEIDRNASPGKNSANVTAAKRAQGIGYGNVAQQINLALWVANLR